MMIRFRHIAAVVLMLGLLFSPVPLVLSYTEPVPLTHEGSFIYPKWTWDYGFPTHGGDLRMDLNFTFDPMRVDVKLPGAIYFNQHSKTLKVEGAGGHFTFQGGAAITGAVDLNFQMPAPILFFSGLHQDVHISRQMPISYVNYPYDAPDGKWHRSVALDSYLLRSTRTGNSVLHSLPFRSDMFTAVTDGPGHPRLSVRAATPGFVGAGAWDVDIAATLADALAAPRLAASDAQAAQILANHLKDYLHAEVYLGFRLFSEYTFACKTLTVNDTPITDAGQVMPAPHFNPTEPQYAIQSTYDADFTYGLTLNVDYGVAAATFVVLNDIELWRYEAAVVQAPVALLPKQSYAMDFADVSHTVTLDSKRPAQSANGILPDPDLADAVRRALGRKWDDPPITPADLQNLTRLHAAYADIRSLAGLQHAVNLTDLDLSYNSVSDMSLLSSLKKLESLEIRGNPFSELSLSDLPNLTAFHLPDQVLSALSLANLPNLASLDLEGSTVSKLSLAALPHLHKTHPERHAGAWGSLPFERPLAMNLSHLGISELSLSDLPHIQELDLSDNRLSDLSRLDLKGTPNLTHLNLHNNGISEIFPHLSGSDHSKLIWLNLSNNRLTAAPPSAPALILFLNLKTLDLSNNQIATLPAVELNSNTRLMHLNLENNLISDVSALLLAVFPNLVDLNLNDNQISELALAGHPNHLELLQLANNPISKVSVSDLPKLHHIPIEHTLSELSLSGLPSVPGFTLSRHPLLSKVSLSDLPNLKELYIFDNPRLSEVALSGLPNLTYLRFTRNDGLSTVSLPELPSLTTLICPNNSLSDISFLKEWIALTELELSDNLISDVSPLSNLTHLTALRLSNNLVSDVSPLSNLTSLTELRLGNNLVSDVSALSNLTNLTELELRNNLISDVTPLLELPNLSRRDFTHSNNPLDPELLRAYKAALGMAFSPPSGLPVLVKIAGDGQVGAPGATLPAPFVVQALDAKEQPVSGASLRFFVYAGDGTLSSQNADAVVVTDAAGQAETVLTLGPNPGPNRVAAIGYDGFKASFLATATLDIVTPPQVAEDVNGDGAVNILDLVFVGSHLGATGEHAADVNGDGVVDIRDLVQVSAAL